MVTCPRCGYQVPAGVFCASCGEMLPRGGPAWPADPPATAGPGGGGPARYVIAAVAVGLVLLALVVGGVLLTRGDGGTNDASQAMTDSQTSPATGSASDAAQSEPADEEQPPAAEDEPSQTADPMSGYRFLMGRAWRGTAQSWNTGKQYQLVLRLDDTSGFPIPGTVAMTNPSGRTGRWEVLAYESPNGLDVQPGDWITRPGGDWSRDAMALSWSDEFSLGAELTGEGSPGQPWGSATLE